MSNKNFVVWLDIQFILDNPLEILTIVTIFFLNKLMLMLKYPPKKLLTCKENFVFQKRTNMNNTNLVTIITYWLE